MAGEKLALRVRVNGRVQGVSFRAWTKAEADARELSGWVRNEPDGSVLARIEGPSVAVSSMLDALKRGPALARVDEVSTTPDALSESVGFEISVSDDPL